MTKDKEFEQYQRTRNGLDTWENMRKLDDPELQKELDETELKLIKSSDVRFNKDLGSWTDQYYQKYSMQEANRIRAKVRKEASKFIKDREQLNKFMRSKSYDEYAAGAYERILHRLKDPDRKSQGTNTPPKSDFINPESNTAEKIIPKPTKTTDEILFENFVESQKSQKQQQQDELFNTGIATLKDFK